VPADAIPISDQLKFTTANPSDNGGVSNYTCLEGGGCESQLTNITTTTSNGTGLAFTEPGSSVISDYVYAFQGRIGFSSDDESGKIILPFTPDPANFEILAETGGDVDIWDEFSALCYSVTDCTTNPANSGFEVLTLTFSSDVNEAQGVPEPATWAMFLLGFLGLGILRRRNAKDSFSYGAVRVPSGR